MDGVNFKEKIDVHNHEESIKTQEYLLEYAKITQENKQAIKDFLNYCKVDPKIGNTRILKYAYMLRRIGELVDKQFKEIDEKDMNALLAKIQDLKSNKKKTYSINTLTDFRRTISKFWRWLYYDKFYGDAPPCIKRMRLKSPIDKSEPEIFSKEEIKKLLGGMLNVRNKAFFACMYDLQCRVAELLSRQVKHIQYTEDGNFQILIEATKSNKSHWETLYESASLFSAWLNTHPFPNEPNAPLWVLMRKKGDVRELGYANTRKIFLNACKRQKIRVGKRSNMHMLRKSKATHDIADGVPLTYVESRGSWSKGSRALQECYLSVQQQDKNNAYRKKYGMPSSNGDVDKTLLKSCERCHVNLSENIKFCHNCGFPTDKSIMAKMQEINKATTELVDNNMLSEMIKKIVIAELENGRKRK
ncbi:MAG: tyrosine-type recombinase/integrase [Candidatus Aenigmarchaeota archaeon]|nr:tyrosine-type recombinase/integrase [Candidatus Aenigmarchaeota archaeon]